MKPEIEEERKFTISFPRDAIIKILQDAGFEIPNDASVLTNGRHNEDLKLYISWLEE